MQILITLFEIKKLVGVVLGTYVRYSGNELTLESDKLYFIFLQFGIWIA